MFFCHTVRLIFHFTSNGFQFERRLPVKALVSCSPQFPNPWWIDCLGTRSRNRNLWHYLTAVLMFVLIRNNTILDASYPKLQNTFFFVTDDIWYSSFDRWVREVKLIMPISCTLEEDLEIVSKCQVFSQYVNHAVNNAEVSHLFIPSSSSMGKELVHH